MSNFIVDQAEYFLTFVQNKQSLEYKKILANIFTSQKNYSEALTIIEELLKQFPNERDLWLQLKECQTGLGQIADVEKTIIRLLGFRQDLGDLITEFGLIKMQQQKFAEARILFNKATQTNSNSIIAHLNLGIACIELKQYDDARRSLSSANILDPSNQAVWIHLCRVATILSTPAKQSPDLQPCLRECVKLSTEDPALLASLYDLLQNQGLRREADLIYNKMGKVGQSRVEEPPQSHEERLGSGASRASGGNSAVQSRQIPATTLAEQ